MSFGRKTSGIGVAEGELETALVAGQGAPIDTHFHPKWVFYWPKAEPLTGHRAMLVKLPVHSGF